jgi:glycosyltransferase involved in cell wall biosynthesis
MLLFVGRFVASKRVPLLIRAYRRARPAFRVPAPLLIWGGFTGEWEGEHPVTVARRVGAEGVFFTGWRGHEELALGLNGVAVLVAPSVNEPFGQVYLEAMASGLPVIATQSGGPLTIVNVEHGQPSGWLVPPDDEQALADALVEAVNDAGERARRAANAYQQVRERFAWQHIAARVEQLYDEVRASETT